MQTQSEGSESHLNTYLLHTNYQGLSWDITNSAIHFQISPAHQILRCAHAYMYIATDDITHYF